MPASSYARVLGANDRVRVGVVGFSDRFRTSLLPAFHAHAAALDFEIVGVSDIWTRRRGGAQVGRAMGRAPRAFHAIIARARREESRVGYFAALYRNVTASVQRGIVNGRFQDGTRMARLDVIFANRYLDAERAWRAGRAPSGCWRVAFEHAARWPPLVLQHLMLGMNAHITPDLEVAAAEVAPGSALPALERDFGEINRLLGEMIDDVQRRIASVSPWMHVLDRVGQRSDETLCGFCLGKARDVAWRAAALLAPLDGTARGREITALDALATALTVPIRAPGPIARTALLGVRLRETADPSRVIEVLDGRR